MNAPDRATAHAPTVALSAVEVQQVREVLEGALPGATVAVFGSRVTGRARPYSDLDLLVLEPPSLSWAQRADLRDAFEASRLPFKVDVVDVASLAEGMASRVRAEALPLPGPTP